MKNLDKKIIVFSIIAFLFLLGFLTVSILEVIETNILKSLLFFIAQIILYIIFFIFTIITIIFVIKNYKKNSTNIKTKKLLIVLFTVYSISIILAFLFPNIARTVNKQIIEISIASPAKKVINKTISSDKNIYFIDDIKKISTQYKDSSYIKYFNKKPYFCLEEKDYIIYGTLDNYKVKKKEVCEFILYEEEAETYIKKYYKEKYPQLNTNDMVVEKECSTNGVTMKCKNEFHITINTYYGEIKTKLEIKDNKIEITDNIEEIYENIKDIQKRK